MEGVAAQPADVAAREQGRRCLVRCRFERSRGRRSCHLYLTVHDDERVIASRAVQNAKTDGTEVLLLPHVPERPELSAGSFGRLRQRSDLAHAEGELAAPVP